eukprot:16435104-Heterocapsa_arctica.AAC.1
MHPMHQAECRVPAVESLGLAAIGRKHRGIDDVYRSGRGEHGVLALQNMETGRRCRRIEDRPADLKMHPISLHPSEVAAPVDPHIHTVQIFKVP